VGVRAVLQGCPLLRDTDVEEAGGISSELRLELTRRRCFTDLRLDRWKDLIEELTLEILKVSPSLTSLNCKSLVELTDAVLVVCAQHCPLLESITLEDCTWMTNDGVQVLASCLGSKLREVRLGSHIQLSDEAVLAVAQHCPRLEQVSCPRLTLNATVVKLAKACPRLTHVYLCDTKVSDAGLTALATHCVHLKEVYLYDCWGVTMYGVRSLAAHCKHLTKLALNIRLSHPKLPPQLRRNSACVVVYVFMAIIVPSYAVCMCVEGTYDKIIHRLDISHNCALTIFSGSGTSDSAVNLKSWAAHGTRLTNLRTILFVDIYYAELTKHQHAKSHTVHSRPSLYQCDPSALVPALKQRLPFKRDHIGLPCTLCYPHHAVGKVFIYSKQAAKCNTFCACHFIYALIVSSDGVHEPAYFEGDPCIRSHHTFGRL
jgi:hypothetical protein